MYTGIINTTFNHYKISGQPYKVSYYMVGGSWRVPVHQVDESGKGTGINSSAGFRTEEEAKEFYETGTPGYAIY